MNHAIEVHLKPVEGALLRILGLIECRGFKLINVNLQSPVAGQHQLSLVVCSPNRNIDVLKRQIMRLFDVVNVFVTASDARAAATSLSPVLKPLVVSESS